MIVLDEQLLGRGIETEIAGWYPGGVSFVTELRPGSVIKDDAIPMLLSQARDPLFVTINVTDFWQKMPLSERYCLVCVAVTDHQASEVPGLLRRLLRRDAFSSKASRGGRAFRLTLQSAYTYSIGARESIELSDWA